MLEPTPVEEAQARLLRRIAAQDREALAEFYDQTAGVLFSTAVRILGDSHDAEEVVQDVFVQIWKKAATFKDELGAPFHWALGIVRNQSIDRLRARQRRSRVIDNLDEDHSHLLEIAGNDNPLQLSADELDAVRTAVKNLPEDQRHAIELAFFRGLTHPEIAAELNEPLGTIKARIRRGLLKLRDHLQAYA